MIYEFLRNLSNENAVWSKNLLPPRAHFFPASGIDVARSLVGSGAASRSDRTFDLCGKWDFVFLPLVGNDAPPFDSDKASWTRTDVPSGWESQKLVKEGVYDHKGLKILSADCGVYRTHFNVFDKNDRHLLSFERVGGAFQIFINGVFAGYSLFGGGEFDVSALVKEGENELVVEVERAFRADFFDCGYKYKASGITGGVTLTVQSSAYLTDYVFGVSGDGIMFDGVLNLSVTAPEDTEISVSLEDKGKVCERFSVVPDDKGRAKVVFHGAYNAYSAETPYLYDAFVRIFVKGEEVECTRLDIGFRTLKVSGGELRYCDFPVKLRGVVYDCVYNADGTLMTADDYRRDLKLLKSYNINALVVDAPLEPYFIKLCSETGFYVIEKIPIDTEEAFRELRGAAKAFFDSDEASAYMQERTLRAYVRDRSEACVFVYSFGEETKSCRSVAAAISTLAAQCDTPVLYGGASVGENAVLAASPEYGKLDCLISETKVPIFIDGVSVGENVGINDFEKYVRSALGAKKVFGVCVKKFRNADGEKGSALFGADGAPTEVGTLYKYACRPLTARLIENRCLEVRNMRSFAGSGDIEITVYAAKGDAIEQISSLRPNIAAGAAREFEIYAGETEPGMRLLVQYDYIGGGRIATETIPFIDEEASEDKIASYRAKTYFYTVRNTVFSLDKLHENILPPRAYFVPCSSEEVCIAGEAYNSGKFSDRVFGLSGEWDFAYFPALAPIEFSSGELNWNKITLPCSFESCGAEKMRFVSGYPFKANLRTFSISDTEDNVNTTGIYRRIINIGDTSFCHILSFAKVNGSIELHINGVYAGYSMLGKGEFDISDKVVLGENEVVVIVKKWTPASYLDGGDGFSATGIIGDVTLIKRRYCGLFDYDIRTRKEGAEYTAGMKFSFSEPADKNKARIELKKDGKTLYEKLVEDLGNGEVSLDVSGNFIGYTSERPELYDVFVKVYEKGFLSECTRLRLGFGDMKIYGDTAYYNDIPLKLRGVTYNPVYNCDGRLITFDDVKRDLALIKNYGFNAVQPLHYVSAEFMQYCRAVGVYVIPRLGVNTKGTEKINPKLRNAVVGNKKFGKLISETVNYEYARDKNGAEILFYQFVEDGASACMENEITRLKARTDKPVSAYGDKGDIIGSSYPTINGVIDLVNVAMNKKPVFFAKYASGGGIGCASMHEFEDIISNSPCCLGGCVAHFVDDYINNSGCKTNGIFTSDRSPYAGAESIRYLYRPVKSELTDGGAAIVMTNTRSILGTGDIKVCLAVVKSGKTVSRAALDIDIPPHANRKYDVFFGHAEGDMYLNVEYYEKSTDRLMYTEQHGLNSEIMKFDCPLGKEPLEVTELFDNVDIKFDCGYVRFNKEVGSVVRYNIMGKDIIKPESIMRGANGFVNNLYRPFVRNMDKGRGPVYTSKPRDFTVEYKEGDSVKQVHVDIENLIYAGDKECYIIQDKYIVNASGMIEVFSVLTPLKRGLPVMDCFGKQLRLGNAFGNILYYGNGAGDNYIDMCEHTAMGIYSINVDKTFEHMHVLQECGNRTNVRYAVIRDGDGDGIMVVARKVPYQLRVSPYSDKEIFAAYKSGARPAQSGVYVDINAFVSGIGSNNDGYPLPQYAVCSNEHVLHFNIVPFSERIK